MPETPVHEDHSSTPRENDIRRAWEIASLEPESVSHSMKTLPNT